MNKVFAILVLICALGLSSTAAYYSIIGLSMLFVGVKLPVIVMASFLEGAKVLTAAVLHSYWGKINRGLKIYLTLAVVIISLITSVGIYGLLTSGYQKTNIEYSIMQENIGFEQTTLTSYENQRDIIVGELDRVDQDVSTLRTALATNIVQYADESGNIITTTSSANRRIYEEQLNRALSERNTLSQNLNVVRDSIRTVSNRVQSIGLNSDLSKELGPLIYLSELTNRPMDVIVNYLMLVIIFVFDPLAISLVITSLFLFGIKRKKTEIKEDVPPIESKSYFIGNNVGIDVEGGETVLEKNVLEEPMIEEPVLEKKEEEQLVESEIEPEPIKPPTIITPSPPPVEPKKVEPNKKKGQPETFNRSRRINFFNK